MTTVGRLVEASRGLVDHMRPEDGYPTPDDFDGMLDAHARHGLGLDKPASPQLVRDVLDLRAVVLRDMFVWGVRPVGKPWAAVVPVSAREQRHRDATFEALHRVERILRRLAVIDEITPRG